MEKAQDARTKNNEGAMKDAAALKATNFIQEYYNKVYVENDDTTKTNFNNTGEYVIAQFDDLSTEGGFTYNISDTNKLTVSDSKGNTVTGTILDNGNINWGTTADNGGGSGGDVVTPVEPLEIGETVNYSTTLNEQTLTNWKVFLSDENYTYLIYGNFLPNSEITSAIKTNHNLGTYSTYGVYANNSREDLISAMATKSNWRALITNGKINGEDLSNDIKSDETNIYAIGSPTLEQWVNSWNTNYQSKTVHTRYVDTEDIDSEIFYATGYAIGYSENPTSDNISTLIESEESETGYDETGYDNTLYFPYQNDVDECYGYLLSSLAADGNDFNNIMQVYTNGLIGHDSYYDDVYSAVRPIICLPTSVVATGVANQ